MKTILVIIALTMLVIAGMLGYSLKQPEQPVGSVQRASEYQATTTNWAWTTTGSSSAVLKYGNGALGSIIVTGQGGKTIDLYDATTTNVSLRKNNPATSTIWMASLPTNASSTTFTFDTIFQNGLLLVYGGGNITGTSTITWR